MGSRSLAPSAAPLACCAMCLPWGMTPAISDAQKLQWLDPQYLQPYELAVREPR
jgi:hypothetical protein